MAIARNKFKTDKTIHHLIPGIPNEVLLNDIFPLLDPRTIIQLSQVSKIANVLVSELIQTDELYAVLKELILEKKKIEDFFTIKKEIEAYFIALAQNRCMKRSTFWRIVTGVGELLIPGSVFIGCTQQGFLAHKLDTKFLDDQTSFLSHCYNQTASLSLNFPTCNSYDGKDPRDLHYIHYTCIDFSHAFQCSVNTCNDLFENFCGQYQLATQKALVLFAAGTILFLLGTGIYCCCFKNFKTLDANERENKLKEIFNDSAFKQSLSKEMISMFNKHFNSQNLMISDIYQVALTEISKFNQKQSNIKFKLKNYRAEEFSFYTIKSNFELFAGNKKTQFDQKNILKEANELTPLLTNSGPA